MDEDGDRVSIADGGGNDLRNNVVLDLFYGRWWFDHVFLFDCAFVWPNLLPRMLRMLLDVN